MRINRSSCRRVVGLALLAAGMASPAVAQASRTWVSGFGNDANACTFSAPCRSFQRAISQTNAGGEVDARDPGEYDQSFSISKAITIDGGPGIATVGPSINAAITIVAGSSDIVILRNLSIKGDALSTSGVHVTGGLDVIVDHCQITGFDDGINFQPLGGMNLTVTDTSLEKNRDNGIVTSTNGAFFARLSATRVRLDANGGNGMLVVNNSLVFVKDSTASNNTFNGFYVAAPAGFGAAQLSLENTSSSNNGNAGVVSQNVGAVVRLSNTTIDHNGGAGVVPLAGGLTLSYGNNKVAANAAGNGTMTGPAPLM